MFLHVMGRHLPPKKNEVHIVPGWEALFSEIATPDPQERCIMRLEYKRLKLESFLTKEVAEAALHFDFESMMEHTSKILDATPNVIVEFAVFSHQVLVAALLSRYKATKIECLEGGEVIVTPRKQWSAKEILKVLYNDKEDRTLFQFAVSDETWKMICAVMRIQVNEIRVKDGALLLSNDEEKMFELRGLLSKMLDK